VQARAPAASRWARCERRAHADYTWGVESDTERRRQGRLWLDGWRAAGERLERERWQHVQALDEDSAWEQAQELFALVESLNSMAPRSSASSARHTPLRSPPRLWDRALDEGAIQGRRPSSG